MFFLLSPIFSLLSKESLSFKIIKSQFTNVPDSAGAHGAVSQHNVTIIWYPQENTAEADKTDELQPLCTAHDGL